MTEDTIKHLQVGCFYSGIWGGVRQVTAITTNPDTVHFVVFRINNSNRWLSSMKQYQYSAHTFLNEHAHTSRNFFYTKRKGEIEEL